MNIIKNMKKLLVSFIFLLVVCTDGFAFASVSDVVITELQTESTTSAGDEYIRITNNTASAVDITNWHVQYFAATSTSFTTPTRNIALSGLLQSGASYVVASTGYKTSEAKVFFGPTLSSSGGHVRLISGAAQTEYEHDRFGWGTALLPEGTAASLVPKDSVYKRRQENGKYIDTNNNKNDFAVPLQAVGTVSTNTIGTAVAHDVRITELLPDPVAPAIDANDEYIELFNAGQDYINLKGLKLQSGNSYSYSYTFSDETLAPNEYRVFYSSVTGLALSNTSGGARLLGIDGTVMSEAEKYTKAMPGIPWQLYQDIWSWGASASPGRANDAAAASSSTLGATTATAKKAASSTNSSKTKVTTKTSSTKKPEETVTQKTNYKNPTTEGAVTPVNPLVLAGVGIVAVGYIVYEYRRDIANICRKLSRNRANSQKAREIH
jgi:hypothetical protein